MSSDLPPGLGADTPGGREPVGEQSKKDRRSKLKGNRAQGTGASGEGEGREEQQQQVQSQMGSTAASGSADTQPR